MSRTDGKRRRGILLVVNEPGASYVDARGRDRVVVCLLRNGGESKPERIVTELAARSPDVASSACRVEHLDRLSCMLDSRPP